MRLAVVGPAHPYKGGGAQHATELAHRLAAAGHQVALESWSAQYPRWAYPGQQTVDAPETPLYPQTRHTLAWWRPDSWLRLGRRLGRQVDAVVLFVYSPVQVPAYLGVLRGLRGGATSVALCNNVLPHEPRPADRRLMRALLRRVDAVFVHDRQQAALARSLAPTPVLLAALAPHLPGTVRRLPEPRAPLRRLLFFGLVRRYKGLDVLLHALAAGPDGVALTVAGEFWGGEEETRRLVDQLGLAARVTLRPGYLPAAELPALFGSVDALVLPYRTATASQNALLAFAFGVPVIATRAGSLAADVHDGVDGVTCAPDDVGDLTRALHRFYRPGEPQRLRRGVPPVDPQRYWTEYLRVLLRAAEPRQSAGSPARRR